METVRNNEKTIQRIKKLQALANNVIKLSTNLDKYWIYVAILRIL